MLERGGTLVKDPLVCYQREWNQVEIVLIDYSIAEICPPGVIFRAIYCSCNASEHAGRLPLTIYVNIAQL